MRLVARSASLVLLICLSAGGFGQDLTEYRMLGNLVPHSATAPESCRSSLLIYRNRGVCFHVLRSDGTVISATVFQPAVTPPPSPSTDDPGLVIPGVGTCGIRIGMSKDQIGQNLSPRSARMVMADDKGAVYDLGDRNMLFVHVRDGEVSEIVRHGAFQTAEGISRRSDATQIEAVYGPPDEYYDIQWKIDPAPQPGLFLIMPFAGLVTGLYIRWARSRMAGTRGSIVWMALFGAIGMSLAVGSYYVAMSIHSGLDMPLRAIPHFIAAPAIIGAGAVLILESVSQRIGGWLRYPLALIPMLLVAAAVQQVTLMVRQSLFLSVIGELMWMDGPFIVCVLFAAGAGRPSETE